MPLQVEIPALILTQVLVPAQSPVLVGLLALPFDLTLTQRLLLLALHQ